MENRMHLLVRLAPAVVAFTLSLPAAAQEPVVPRPNVLVRQILEGMPKGDKQEVSILTATLKPGAMTVHHTHRFPVGVYVIEGAFTLEVEGGAPVTIKAGEAMTEPAKTKMTGYNRTATDTKVVIFYVADPGTPFLDAIH
jgi:quercetin dioxygenase-like cupin family protein